MRCRPLRGWASSCQLLSGTIHFLPNRLCQIVLPAGVRSVPSRGSSVHRIVSDNGPLLPYALVRNFGSNAAIGREWLTFLALLRGYLEEATTPVHGLCPQAVDCNESAASAGRVSSKVELTELAIPHLRPNVGRFPTSRDEGPAANLVRTSFCFSPGLTRREKSPDQTGPLRGEHESIRPSCPVPRRARPQASIPGRPRPWTNRQRFAAALRGGRRHARARDLRR